MRMTCPHCNGAAHIRTSRQMTLTARELRYQCINVECGHTWVSVLEAIRTIVPSQCPNPKVFLQHAKRPGAPPDARQMPLAIA